MSISERYRVEMLAVNKQHRIPIVERTQRLERSYLLHFAPLFSRSDASAEELQALYDGASMMAAYTGYHRQSENSRYIEDMTKALRLLRARGVDKDENVRGMYGALLSSRRFDEARAFAAAEPSLSKESIPHIDRQPGFDSRRPAYFEVPQTGDVLLRNAPEFSKGIRIIVVSGCHIAHDAARAITADESLISAFARAQALWLAPPERNFDVEEIRRWNAEIPRAPMRMVFSTEPWRGIDFSGMPTFYVFRDGKQIAKLSGWREVESLAQLRTVLREVGLLEVSNEGSALK